MVDTCHWSSLTLATQLVCGFHTPYSHFCAHIHWKAFSHAHTRTHAFWKLKLEPPSPPRVFQLLMTNGKSSPSHGVLMEGPTIIGSTAHPKLTTLSD